MIILYGSQTGNSIYISKLIQNTILHGYNSETIYNVDKELRATTYFIDLDSFDFTKILEVKIIIFVCSTHGNGTEPFNMTKFWKTLRNKNLPPNFLCHLKFAVFGLGDSSYKSFNFCAKKLYNCLIKHGAKPLLRRGNGDSQDKEGFLSDFKIWIEELYSLVGHHKLKNAYEFAVSKSLLKDAILLESKYLTPPGYEYPILELKFDISIVNFCVGDCLAIYPENYNYFEFANFNDIKSDEFLLYIKKSCDFNSLPHPHFFLKLSSFASLISEEHRKKIREIYDNYDLYYDYILVPKRTIFEVIKDFRIKLSQDFILLNIPTINPRYFTLTKICDFYYVTVSLVSYQTRLKDKRKGLCSEYLKLLTPKTTLKVGVVSNKLNIVGKKVIFICTGTGITLPRAYIHSNYKELSSRDILVLYGFRYRNKDLLYDDEFKKYGITVHHAVSREDKKYVQNIFQDLSCIEDIDDWSIFVSGNSRLNNIIEKLFTDIFKRKIYFQTETW